MGLELKKLKQFSFSLHLLLLLHLLIKWVWNWSSFLSLFFFCGAGVKGERVNELLRNITRSLSVPGSSEAPALGTSRGSPQINPRAKNNRPAPPVDKRGAALRSVCFQCFPFVRTPSSTFAISVFVNQQPDGLLSDFNFPGGGPWHLNAGFPLALLSRCASRSSRY